MKEPTASDSAKGATTKRPLTARRAVGQFVISKPLPPAPNPGQRPYRTTED